MLRKLIAASALLGLATLAQAAPGDLAVYIGSFDPLHEGHMAVIRGALPDLGVDKVLVIPKPSTSKEIAPLKDRLAMARAQAFRDKQVSAPDAKLAQILREGGPEWRPRVYAYLFDQLQGDGLVQEIVGIDRFNTALKKGMIPAASEPRMLIVVDRPGYPLDVGLLKSQNVTPGKILFLHPEVLDISSAKIRRKIQRGKDVFGLVPNVVRKVIEANNLYR